MRSYILSFSCPDRLGVVARYSSLLADAGAFITEVSNYTDPVTERFFLRCVFDDRALNVTMDTLSQRWQAVADELNATWVLRASDDLPRIVLAVSAQDHCLSALLTKWRAGALPAEIVGVVSNHELSRGLVEWHGLPFYYLPVTKETKPQQEQEILSVFSELDGELLVLARYMQILSDGLCQELAGRAINIHHSFLPGFKGAKPYHRAWERGVKVIGATAHYVTADLDEGPIITQEVRPIDHETTVERMIHLGQDVEANALSQAVRLHCEQRVLLNGQRTVIL
ncbi:formyltetrahydrofolate deformylase [Luminiphilus syltensis NOR5-1B]|uniref:Formyltetrahydrofolate deformylase n=1 Tax=Luminiphilus syltensis NOR5-1B TaxID=565045 RepID=B8KTQ8_9GAMM|nr:formyltetrahydrofolate deformylase [Luminiphilus syltensis]EED35659.1 formyltetrahydrofolate deformylase [Luminiphilus syltensis NOR5-1B]